MTRSYRVLNVGQSNGEKERWDLDWYESSQNLGNLEFVAAHIVQDKNPAFQKILDEGVLEAGFENINPGIFGDDSDDEEMNPYPLKPWFSDYKLFQSFCKYVSANKHIRKLSVNNGIIHNEGFTLLADLVGETGNNIEELEIVQDDGIGAIRFRNLARGLFSAESKVRSLSVKGKIDQESFKTLCNVIKHPACKLKELTLRVGSLSVDHRTKERLDETGDMMNSAKIDFLQKALSASTISKLTIEGDLSFISQQHLAKIAMKVDELIIDATGLSRDNIQALQTFNHENNAKFNRKFSIVGNKIVISNTQPHLQRDKEVSFGLYTSGSTIADGEPKGILKKEPEVEKPVISNESQTITQNTIALPVIETVEMANDSSNISQSPRTELKLPTIEGSGQIVSDKNKDGNSAGV